MVETGRIDVHHHLLTEFYIKAQQRAGITGTAYRGFPEWTPQHSLSVMENEGITSTILSFTSPGIWFGDIFETKMLACQCNDYLANLAERYPGRFGGFGFLPLPNIDAAMEETARIYNVHLPLSEKIENKLKGWNKNTIQGRMMNKKNAIMYGIMDQIYMEPKYLTPCRAGSIFGVIEADGTVKSCEILDKNIGNLRDYEFDFLKLWCDQPAEDMRKWISDTECNCHYDCAWSFNILANKEFQLPLMLSALGKDI